MAVVAAAVIGCCCAAWPATAPSPSPSILSPRGAGGAAAAAAVGSGARGAVGGREGTWVGGSKEVEVGVGVGPPCWEEGGRFELWGNLEFKKNYNLQSTVVQKWTLPCLAPP